MKPTIGRIVHYTSYGTPGGEYPSVCRAAIITAVTTSTADIDQSEFTTADLFVMNPEGIFLNKNVIQDEDTKKGGTWHWPERETE